MAKKTDFFDGLDPLIRPAVEVLNAHGFKTFESCQGTDGHAFPEPTVRFNGSEYDLIRAFEICLCYKLNVLHGRRVFSKDDVYKNEGIGVGNESPIGYAFGIPVNELTFSIHSKTGTIYLPN